MRKARYLLVLFSLFYAFSAVSGDTNWRYSGKASSTDLFFKENTRAKDPVIDDYRTIDLGLNLAVGSDCGRINISTSLKSTLSNLLNTKYFERAGMDIIAGMPLLLLCYFSPTYCSALKHLRVSANSLSQLQFNQCALMDKYVDSRVSDFQKERQECIRQQMASGNVEQATRICGNRSLYNVDLANWAGRKFGSKASTNKLIGSSARWAGYNSGEQRRAVDLIKAFVGDSVVSRGQVSVEYGPKLAGLSPRRHIANTRKFTEKKLCQDFLTKIDKSRGKNIADVISQSELDEVNGGHEFTYIDHQVVKHLAILPRKRRSIYCRRLAASVSTARAVEDFQRSLEMLREMGQNPNLPPERAAELEKKRRGFSNAVKMTIELNKVSNESVNRVVGQIVDDGYAVFRRISDRQFNDEVSIENNNRADDEFFDCADGISCKF